MIHRPNFGENGRNFEVVMNRQTFFRVKRVEEREGEGEIRINLKMIHCLGDRERGKRGNLHN